MNEGTLRLEEMCRHRRLLVRGRRSAILNVLDAAEDYLTLDEIFRRAVARDRRITYTTFYRTVSELISAGLVTVIEIAGTETRYRRASDHHSGHLIDVDSCKVLEFSSRELDNAIGSILKSLGYELQSYNIRLTGRKMVQPAHLHVGAETPLSN
jgi:Fur family transcriptional regulator, ferric uptake regulator